MSGIYIASKTKHAPLWVGLRKTQRFPINCTWIDEAGPGETEDPTELAMRCWYEVIEADAFILYREEGDELKGAFVELGIAIQLQRPIYAVGLDNTIFKHLPHITHCDTIEQAFTLADTYVRTQHASS